MSMSPFEDWYDDLAKVHRELLARIKELEECDSSRDFEQDAMDLLDDVVKGKYDAPKLR